MQVCHKNNNNNNRQQHSRSLFELKGSTDPTLLVTIGVFYFPILEDEKVVEVETPTPRRRAYSTDRDELSLIRTMIFDLQEEKDKLKQTDIRLNDELYKKQKHLDDLYNLVDELRDVKADKELLSLGFELKADKREVEAKIGREDFEHYMSLVDQSLRDLLQRLDGHVS